MNYFVISLRLCTKVFHKAWSLYFTPLYIYDMYGSKQYLRDKIFNLNYLKSNKFITREETWNCFEAWGISTREDILPRYFLNRFDMDDLVHVEPPNSIPT